MLFIISFKILLIDEVKWKDKLLQIELHQRIPSAFYLDTFYLRQNLRKPKSKG